MQDDNLTIERVLYSDDSTMMLYRLSNGTIINVDEAVNYVRQGMLKDVVVVKDEKGQHYIKPASGKVWD